MKFVLNYSLISILLLTLFTLSISYTQEDLINISDYIYPTKENESSDMIYIPILSTNDLHGKIFPSKYADSNRKRYSNGGANYIYSFKKILEEEWGDRLLWLDAGDQFQGTIECMLSQGTIMRDYYNKAGLDGIALGNHDFDYGSEYLKNYIKTMDFPLIVSNVKENGEYIYNTWENTVAYKIYEKKIIKGDDIINITIGVIGLATDSTPQQTSTDLSNFTFTDYAEETKKWNDYLRNEKKVDSVILLTHLGPYCPKYDGNKYVLKIRTEKSTQQECDSNEASVFIENLKKNNINIDGIIAGHVHNIVHLWMSDIPVVVSPGADYFNILYLSFKYSKETKSVIFDKSNIKMEGPVPVCEKLWPESKNCIYKYEDSSLMKNYKFHEKEIILDEGMKSLLNNWEVIINEKVEKNLIETDDELRKGDNDNALTNLINDIGRKVTDSDICFFNTGGIRSGWHKGPINEIDLFNMFPFNNTWIRFEMTGEEVYRAIQELNYKSILPFSGVKRTFKNIDNTYILVSLKLFDGINEMMIEPEKTYKICTNNFLAEGGSEMNDVRKWYKELKNEKEFGIIREIIKKFLSLMKGHIKKDKFLDLNHPGVIIE